MEGKRPRTCSSLRAIQRTRWNVYHVALKYLCSDRLYFVFDRRRGSRLPAILTVSIYREIYIYISELRLYRYYNGKTVESYRSPVWFARDYRLAGK